jgi:hypothetical protein
MDINTIKAEYGLLNLRARNLHDMMQTRIRISNREGAFLRAGYAGLALSEADVPRGYEKAMKKELVVEMHKIIGPHMKAFIATPGVGDAAARVLGELGHPVLAFPAHWEDRPGAKGTVKDPKRVLVEDEPFERMVSQLWSYCGYGNAERKYRIGMTAGEAAACGNPTAKMLVHLMAVSCMRLTGVPDKNGVVKARSPYRNVYDERRVRYDAERPEWSDGRRHAASLRVVKKEILKDLWIAAKADLAEDTGEVLLAA